jgi:HlyD family secretion protein/epimerase transport system membrane fusion protein
MSAAQSLVPYDRRMEVSLADMPGTASLALSTRAPRRAGLLLVFLFLGGFLAWGLTVPIAGGAVAPGVISPDGNRRTVQHLEGGIIAALRVRDGDKVSAGQPLLLLESLQARAIYNSLLGQYRTLLVMQARLEAEQANRPGITLPAEIEAASGQPELAKLIAGQRAIFAARRAAQETRAVILRLRVEQAQEQIRALEAQVRSTVEQLSLIGDELRGKEQLLRSGLVPRPEVLRLQRAQAELLGRQGEYLGTIARTRQVIGETEMQLVSLEADRLDKVSDQVDKVRVELAGVTERLEASRDVLARTAVLAPITGTVINLRFKTVEGVIRPGEPILDIVPDEEKLLIDARVAPTDIDVVHGGLPAQVRLTAYSSHGLPRIDGIVRSVSADRLQDPASHQPYYLARVEVDREALEHLGPHIALVPGMPAEVLIVRRSRTMVHYLIEPFRDAFRRSFREV